jgi:hypothetical protein
MPLTEHKRRAKSGKVPAAALTFVEYKLGLA